MIAGIIIIVIVVALFIAWLLVGYVGFSMSIKRAREIDINDRASLKGTAWDRYYNEITKGIRWIEKNKRERVEIISRDGLRLVGRLTLNPKAKGIVLMFHGYRTHPEVDFSVDSYVYYNAGNHILHIDQRASGESEGKYIGFGVLEAKDCKLWCEYVGGRFGEDFPIILAGLSMGGATVLMAVGENLPRSVCRIISDSAFSSPAEVIKNTIKNGYKLKGAGIMTRGIDFWARAGAHFSLYGHDLSEILKNNEIPLFLIHGKRDSVVPWEMSQRAYDASRGQKKLLLVEEANHGTGYLVDTKSYKAYLEEFVKLN